MHNLTRIITASVQQLKLQNINIIRIKLMGMQSSNYIITIPTF